MTKAPFAIFEEGFTEATGLKLRAAIERWYPSNKSRPPSSGWRRVVDDLIAVQSLDLRTHFQDFTLAYNKGTHGEFFEPEKLVACEGKAAIAQECFNNTGYQFGLALSGLTGLLESKPDLFTTIEKKRKRKDRGLWDLSILFCKFSARKGHRLYEANVGTFRSTQDGGYTSTRMVVNVLSEFCGVVAQEDTVRNWVGPSREILKLCKLKVS
jgi:hypothetical protein